MIRLLITGICGFVGNRLAHCLKRDVAQCEIIGLDNFIRPGSELNRAGLRNIGVEIVHGDIRSPSDLESLPKVDWVIDAAANPSVLAGVDGRTSSRQLVEHNLAGTINILEFCRKSEAGFILLSTSRVYSIHGIASLAVAVCNRAYSPVSAQNFPVGIGENGITEAYSTHPPVSLYGASKVASEVLALEYGETFDLPVWINRCGVLAGAGQFGRPDQGIFSYWLHSWKQKRPLQYIGFDGKGYQVRDCLHPDDLAALLVKQLAAGEDRSRPKTVNVAGGIDGAMSLRQLSDWCTARFGPHDVSSAGENRLFDIPWLVLDISLAQEQWDWTPERSIETILEEIAVHAESYPEWLAVSAAH